MTEFKLIRNFQYNGRTFGELYFNDVHICDTCEGEDLYLERLKIKIVYYNAAIPRGTYEMSFYNEEEKKLHYPIIKNVPEFGCVYIVRTYYEYKELLSSPSGSILLCKIDGDFVSEGIEAMDKIMEISKKYGNVLKISVM